MNIVSPKQVCWHVSTVRKRRLLSHLRQTACECVYFRSHDKDGVHIIRSAIARNLMLHAHFTAVSSREPGLLRITVIHCGNRGFRGFCIRDLDLAR